MFLVRGAPRKPFMEVTLRDVAMGRNPQGGGIFSGVKKATTFSNQLLQGETGNQTSRTLATILRKQRKRPRTDPTNLRVFIPTGEMDGFNQGRVSRRRWRPKPRRVSGAGAIDMMTPFNADMRADNDGVAPLPADRLINMVLHGLDRKRARKRQKHGNGLAQRVIMKMRNPMFRTAVVRKKRKIGRGGISSNAFAILQRKLGKRMSRQVNLPLLLKKLHQRRGGGRRRRRRHRRKRGRGFALV